MARASASGAHVYLLGEHAHLARRYDFLSLLQPSDSRADGTIGVAGDTPPAGMGGRGGIAPRALCRIRRSLVSLAPAADGKRRVCFRPVGIAVRSEEHTSELQS